MLSSSRAWMRCRWSSSEPRAAAAAAAVADAGRHADDARPQLLRRRSQSRVRLLHGDGARGARARAATAGRDGCRRRRRAGRARGRGRPPSAHPARLRRARPPRGRDRLPPGLPRDGADGLRALRSRRDVAPRRRAGLARPRAARREVRAVLPLRAVGVRPALPREHDRLHGADADALRRRGAARALPAAADRHRARGPVAGHAVDDGEDRRLRRRRPHHARASRRRRRVAALGRQVVRLERQRRRRAHARASRGRAARHARARPVPGAPAPARRHAERDGEAAASVVLSAAVLFGAGEAGAEAAGRLLRIVTPLAKGWITARARAVAGEAMNVRGGNGYVEEWVNARLLRDAYLGAIWEGSTTVVALDVQRAIVKDGALAPLAAFIGTRLDGVRERHAKPVTDVVRAVLADVERRAAAWTTQPPDTRELEARPVAETLYHALATALLLDEGQTLRPQRQDHHKLLVAALYAHRWLVPAPPGVPAFSPSALESLERLVDWRPIGADALAAEAPVRD